MRLTNQGHLAYCTNIHRGQTWEETWQALRTHVLAVRDRVSPGRDYAIGLRLSAQAAQELSDPPVLKSFRQWLDREQAYVFTINGFPYGQFHGTRVKEQVYAPDWTSKDRLEYTNLLFDLLAQLLPEGIDGSVSTVPGSFKEFVHSPDQLQSMRDHLFQCVEHVAALCAKTGQDLHLGLEPEPMCTLETSAETIAFLEQMRKQHPRDERLTRHLGVNYDTCHLAVEYEQPREAIAAFQAASVRLSKIHLSSALRLTPSPESIAALHPFAEDIYFHQVIARDAQGSLIRYRDLQDALEAYDPQAHPAHQEWRVHFHVPLHSRAQSHFGNTADHLEGVLDLVAADPGLCRHLEMETYTWEVMPPELKNRSVVDQLVSEYQWTLARLAERGINRL